jgi:inosose dehydratase
VGRLVGAHQFALNPLQWVTAARGVGTRQSPDGGDDFDSPQFLPVLDSILARLAASGFPAVMMKVPRTMTIPSYLAMIARHQLRLAPGYVQVALPEDQGQAIAEGSVAWYRWFDAVRRRAEETQVVGLDRVFLASDIVAAGRPRVDVAAAVGHDFDPARLQRVIDLLGTAVDVLAREGVRAGLHNHVGTWVETESEIVAVLQALPTLWCGFDVGHLAWAGIDPVALVARYRERVIDLHLKDIDLSVAAACRDVPTSYQAASAAGVFLEPGLGGVDLVGVLQQLPDGFAGTVTVEVDRPSLDPDASARASWAWVQAHTAQQVPHG